MRRLAVLAGFSWSLLAPAGAAGHGALPEAVDVHFVDLSGSRRLIVESTFGLVHEVGEGVFRLTCEEVAGDGPRLWMIHPDGAWGLAHLGGVAQFPDGCARQPVLSTSDWPRLAVLTRWPSPVAFVLTDAASPSRALLRSLDGGWTFDVLETPEGLRLTALVADDTRPGHVVATAIDPDRAYRFLHSDDAGETWTVQPLEIGGGVGKVLAVADELIVVRRVVPEGYSLHVSDDGGASFVRVLEPEGLPSFVSRTAAGEWWVATEQGEFWRSSDARTWAPWQAPARVRCVRRDGDVLYACVTDLVRSIGVVQSTDGGRTWEDHLRWGAIGAIAGCGFDSTVGRVCLPIWPDIAVQLEPPKKPAPLEPAPPPPPEPASCATTPALHVLALLGLACLRGRRVG